MAFARMPLFAVAGVIAGLIGNRGAAVALSLHSPDFHDSSEIPTVHTCEGADVPPTLAWQGSPATTKSFALIVDDPDAPDPKAPKMTYVHWVLYNIPPDAGGLLGESRTLPAGAREGKNDWSRTGYGGPCPPVGRHRYFFKIYALDTVLPDREGLTKAEVEKAMEGHVLGHAELVGTYQKKGR
jgi:Raf kinase inhibitor-like YbhB/YbcL family protein